jgi:hypothetical protein
VWLGGRLWPRTRPLTGRHPATCDVLLTGVLDTAPEPPSGSWRLQTIFVLRERRTTRLLARRPGRATRAAGSASPPVARAPRHLLVCTSKLHQAGATSRSSNSNKLTVASCTNEARVKSVQTSAETA